MQEDWNQIYFRIFHDGANVQWATMIHSSWIEAGGAVDAITIPDPNQIPGWS